MRVLGESENSGKMRQLQHEIKHSARAQTLLRHRNQQGRIEPVGNPYSKWIGAHWVLAALADIGYPRDPALEPVVAQVTDFWLQPVFATSVVCRTAGPAHKERAVPVIRGRARRCGSQHGNALFAALTIGFHDERTDRLAELLMKWQWPDGGWNCDRRPAAAHSSFFESIIPLRALSMYADRTGSKKARHAAQRAAVLFLKKKLYRRETNGRVMDCQFTKLHYPLYWHYDILHGLKVMAESGFIGDRRCYDALDMLESKRLPDGGWPAEARFYRGPGMKSNPRDLVDWGVVHRETYNEWVTTDALYVLRKAGRL